MTKIDNTVIKETKYIALFTFILSLLLQSLFLVTSNWDYTVLLGNLLGFAAALGNFFLMGLTVQNALTKDEKGARNIVKLSQFSRLCILIVIAFIGYLFPIFNLVAVIIPYLFPRIAIAFRPLFIKNN